MLSTLLFLFYLSVLLVALNRLVKVKQVAINKPVLMGAFLFKIIMGCLYGYIFLKYYHGDDTWMFHQESVDDYQKMIHHPFYFLEDLFPGSAFRHSHNFWQGMQFYIMDLETWSMIKLLAVFNIFSRGNYYINVLFFDFLIFSGPLLLFKLLLSFFPAKKNVLIIILFFMPSATFWLSGIRSEGLLLLFIAMIVYYTYYFFQQKKIRYSLFAIAGLTGLLIFRSEFFILFIPAFFCWTLCYKTPKKSVVYFSITYIICIAVFFGSLLFSENKNLPIAVAGRQKDFFSLHANTTFKLDTLQPSVTSFAKILPQAFTNTLLRPFIWEAKGPLQLLTALNITVFWILLLLVIFYHEKEWRKIIVNPLLLLFVFYSVTQILSIGYTVPFPGAIVRYKIIPELFLILYLAILTDWKKFKTNSINL
jgi:hypothetical protein